MKTLICICMQHVTNDQISSLKVQILMMIYHYHPIIQSATNSMRQLRSSKTKTATSPAPPPPKRTKKPKHTHPTVAFSRRQLKKYICNKLQIRRNKISKEKRKVLKRELLDLLKEQELSCMICLEMLLVPTTLSCGHAFCLRCIQNQSMALSHVRCALCRQSDDAYFHEPDPNLTKMVTAVLTMIGSEEQKAYKKREDKPLQIRHRVSRKLEVGEEVSVRRERVGEYWRPARVKTVFQRGGVYFYQVEIIGLEMTHLLSAKTVNLSHVESTFYELPPSIPSVQQYSLGFMGPQIVPQPYNIDQLLWEVNYYQPPVQNQWHIDIDPMEMESESVLFIGRNPPPQEIIEID